MHLVFKQLFPAISYITPHQSNPIFKIITCIALNDIDKVEFGLASFLNMALQIMKQYIVPLAPVNPRKTTQEEPYAIELSKRLAKRLIKEALHHIEGFLWTEIPSFDKELPHDVGNIPPPLWIC